MADTRGSLLARARYRFDAALARGPSVIMLWLAATTFGLAFIAALLVAVIGLSFDGERNTGVGEGFWQSLLRLLDPGTFSGDSGWPLRIITLMVTVTGIFLATALIGLVATALDQKIGDLRKGRSAVLEDNHTLILGWSPRLFTIIAELVIANENQKHPAIVILATEDKTMMEDEIRSRVPDTKSTRVVCRTGYPTRPDDLAMVNLGGARSIICLGSETPEGDADVVKAVLAVMTDDQHFDRAHVIAELSDPHFAHSLRITSGGRVIPIQADEVIAAVTAQACNQVGLSHVYRELLDFDGDEIYFQAVPDLVGSTFGDSLLAFERSTVLGIAHADGTVSVLPPMDSVYGEGDQVIAVSEDDDTIVFTGLVEATEPPPDLGTVHTRPIERILVVGWSDLAPQILGDLDPFLDPGTVIDVLYDASIFEHDPVPELALKNAHFSRQSAPSESTAIAEMGPNRPYDQIIVLGYREGISRAEADARTLLSLLAARHTWPPNGATRPRIVAEVLDSSNVAIAQAAGVDDFVVSDELSSLMIAQLSERPDLRLVFDELFDAEGASIAVLPALWYTHGGSVRFADIVAAARSLGQVAIGYRLDDGTVAVNPAKSVTVEFGARDDVVVIGQFHS